MREIAKEALKKTELFGNLSENHLLLLASLTGIQDLNPGDFVFRQGDIGNAFYIIIEDLDV